MKNKLFTLRLKTSDDGMIIIHALHGELIDCGSHTRLDIIVRQNEKIIFNKGDIYCGVPAHWSLDGNWAKELVLSTVAADASSIDAGYQINYSQDQKDWVKHYKDLLDLIREMRYCDRNGNVRGKK